jgi:uncharacterized protein
LLFLFLLQLFIMSWIIIAALIASGLLVGFINTLAGGGTIISLSLLMFLGLPADIANGTNRVAVTLQTLSSVAGFRQKHVLDWRKGLLLGLPVIAGSVLGALLAIEVDKRFLEIAFGVVMIIMLVMIIRDPSKWLKGQDRLINRPLNWSQYLIFFIIGLYGGFIHVGVGYFLLAGIVLSAGYDLVHANAIKVFIVLMYVPFTLLIFVFNHKVHWEYGLIHSIGNIAGAWLGTRYAVSWGVNAVRWIMVIIILFSILQVFQILDFKTVFEALL